MQSVCAVVVVAAAAAAAFPVDAAAVACPTALPSWLLYTAMLICGSEQHLETV
jgi:hypothetical protein